MRLRLHEYLANIPLLYGYVALDALPMFLLGLYVGKNKYLYSIDNLVNKLKTPIILFTCISIAYIYFVLTGIHKYFPDLRFSEIVNLILIRLFFVARVVLGMFYLWAIAWIWRFPVGQRLLSPLTYVGQMALTNYIMQSLLGLILFTSVGLGLYETLSPTQTLLTAIGIYCFQVVFSKIWLSQFYHGPLEWLWRCYSYHKVLPLKKGTVAEITYQ